MEIHLRDTLSRLMGVVIVVDVDHQAAQQIANLVCHFNLEFSQLTGLEVSCDVVIGQERDTSLLETFTNAV